MANNMNNNQYGGWGGNDRNSSEYKGWPGTRGSMNTDSSRNSFFNTDASKYRSGKWGDYNPGLGKYSHGGPGAADNTPNYFNSEPGQHEVDGGRWTSQLNRGNFDSVWNKARTVDDPSQHMTEGITSGYSDFNKWKTHMLDSGWSGQGGGSGEPMGGGGPDWVPRRLQNVHQYFANPGVHSSMGWQNPINSRAGRDYAELAKEHNPDQWDARNRRAGMIHARNPLMGNYGMG